MPRPPTRLPCSADSPARPSAPPPARRALLLLALLLCLGAPQAVFAKDAPEATTVQVPGVPAAFSMPASAKLIEAKAPVRGEWVHRSEVPGGELLVRVFPAKNAAEPGALVLQAVQRELRSRGSGGFGMGERKLKSLYGHPAASMAFTGVFGSKPKPGEALLMRLPPQWIVMGFALHTTGTIDPDVQRAFLASLQPTQAKFYSPQFSDARETAHALWTGHGATANETPITRGDIDAVVFCIEASMEQRLSLKHRASLRACLISELQQADVTGREGLRSGTKALALTANETAERRIASLGALGTRIRGALRDRALAKHMPALCALAAESRALRAGLEHGELTNSTVNAHAERAAFLASLCLNRDVLSASFLSDHEAYWNERIQSAEHPDLAEIKGAGLAWAELRSAWAQSDAAQRLAFRKAALAAVASETDASFWQGLPDSRALWSAMDRRGFAAPATTAAAQRLAASTWTTLRALLKPGVGPWQNPD